MANKFSLVSKGLKYKLRIAFYLTLLLPLLVCIYLVSNYILPSKGIELNIVVLIFIYITIGISGFLLIRDIVRRMVSVSSDARIIASGDIDHIAVESGEDELRDLGEALNSLTKRIRENMDELKTYGEKTTEINFEIQRRVFLFSSLLQISSMISQGNKLDDILTLAVEKSRQIVESDTAYLLIKDIDLDILEMKVVNGLNAQYLSQIRLDIEQSIFDDCIKNGTPLVLDAENSVTQWLLNDFYERFRLKNTIAIPMYSRGKLLGLLGIGNNRSDFVYKKDDSEILDIFTKQLAIAIENDLLIQKAEKLEIKDALTGLYNEQFIRMRLEEEIKRGLAYQRPCSFILIEINDLQRLYDSFGSRFAEITLKKVASLLKDSVSDIDRVARFSDNEFALLLPERNKRQAIEIAEEITKKIDFSFSEEGPEKKVTVSGGLSENPIDGTSSEELIRKAKDLLTKARGMAKNIIANR